MQIERRCKNCEYFADGDCHNSSSPRFQTTAEEFCAMFYPDTTRWPKTRKTRTWEWETVK